MHHNNIYTLLWHNLNHSLKTEIERVVKRQEKGKMNDKSLVMCIGKKSSKIPTTAV